MKGPGIRLDLDVRREWECPQCGKRRRATGDVAAVRCGCTRDKENMKLLERQRLTRSFADVIERVQSASTSTSSQLSEPEPAVDDKPPSTGDGVGEATQSPAVDAVTDTDNSPPHNPTPHNPTPHNPTPPNPETPATDKH